MFEINKLGENQFWDIISQQSGLSRIIQNMIVI